LRCVACAVLAVSRPQAASALADELLITCFSQANNFLVEGKYRDEGWVDEEPAGPNFFQRLFGAKAQSEGEDDSA
jgi:hypothetical protein